MSEAVLTKQVAEHVMLVTINRPEARNAVNGDVASGIERAVFDTEKDPNIWVVILTGAGGEDRTLAGDDADPRLVVILEAVDRRFHALGDIAVDGVARLGAADGDDGDVAVEFVVD